jgi:lysophospholipase L1-like esterase
VPHAARAFFIIGGYRVLADGKGPRLLSRFEHDVLDRPGVTHALVLIGVNDLGVLRGDAPLRLQAGYDSGDHPHPSPEGYRAMAAVVPLERLAACRWRAAAPAAKTIGTRP